MIIMNERTEGLGVDLGDVNGDGNLDAVFALGLFRVEENQVCLGDGAGGFTCSFVSADERESAGHICGLFFLDQTRRLKSEISTGHNYYFFYFVNFGKPR